MATDRKKNAAALQLGRGDLTEGDRKWLAAVIDCEGSICVSIERRRRVGWSFSIRPYVSASQNDRRLLERCYALTKLGRISKPQRAANSSLVHFEWKVRGMRPAAALLRLITPHLIVKRERADELLGCLAFYEELMREPLKHPERAARYQGRAAPRRLRLGNRETARIMINMLPWLERHQPDTKTLALCRSALEEIRVGGKQT